MAPTPVKVRAESRADVPTVDVVVKRAFEGRPNEVALVRTLRESGSSTISRVATSEGRVVGHVMYSPLGLEGSVSTVLTLAPLSVEPECQGKGVGTKLIADTLAELDASGVPLVIVLGEPDYYGRFEFRPAIRFGIFAPEGVSTSHLMVRPMTSYTPILRGTLIYPSVFRETGTL